MSDISVTARRLLWPTVGNPGTRPGTLRVTAGLPGGGLFLVEVRASFDPLDLTFQISMLDAPIEPYQAYFPFPAQFKGLFSGDSNNHVKIENGKLMAASQGNGYAKQIEIREPSAENPALTLERMEIRGVDFSWPNYAFVSLVSFLRPETRVERMRRTAPSTSGACSSPSPSPPGAGAGEEGKRRRRRPHEGRGGREEARAHGDHGAGLRPDRDRGGLYALPRPHHQARLLAGHRAPRAHRPQCFQYAGRAPVHPGHAGHRGGDSALDMRGELSGLGDDSSPTWWASCATSAWPAPIPTRRACSRGS